MSSKESKSTNDPVRNLSVEIRRLLHKVESQHRQVVSLESRLRETMSLTGQSVETIDVEPPPPAADRTSNQPTSIGLADLELQDWPLPGRTPQPLVPTPGLFNYGLRSSVIPVVGMMVCGFARAPLDMIVDMIEKKQQQTRDFVPVFFTDSTDFEVFRSRGFVFEYLPSLDRRLLAGRKNWASYVDERLRLLRRKWGISEMITYGKQEFSAPFDVDSGVVNNVRANDAPWLGEHQMDGRGDKRPTAH